MPGKMARSDPRPGVRVTRGAGSGQHLASVLQEGRQNANIGIHLENLGSSVRRRCSALSSWFTRLVRSAISLFNAVIRPRAKMLSSATKKEPSPLTTAGGRSRSNKKHQRGRGKQAGGQYQRNVARQCCDQDWKQEKGERGSAECLAITRSPRLDARQDIQSSDGRHGGSAP